MEGHVRKLGKRWYVTLEIARDPTTGARRRRSLGGYTTQREAREALRAALEQGRRGWQGPERVSVATYFEEWLRGVDLSRASTTAALYRTLLEHHVIPRIGGERLESVTPTLLTRLYSELLAGGGPRGRKLSPKSVRNVHTTIRKAFGDAVADRRLDWNPAEAAKVPRIERDGGPTVWTAAQVATFLHSVDGDRISALWVLVATTGMRRSEALALRWNDVDGERIHIRRALVQYGRLVTEKEPKTARSRRTVALDAAAAEALRRHRVAQAAERLAAGEAYSDEDRVFADEIGRALRPGNVSKDFARAVKAVGLPSIGLHGLRHTFATLGLEAGVDTLYVSEILGHSSPVITSSIYQHARPERLAAAVAKVGDAIYRREGAGDA
jgi:integrase